MKRLKLYLETSVWNFLLADDAPDKRAATELLFREIESGKYSIFVSNVVTQEIRRAPLQKKQLLAGILERYKPIFLEDSEEARVLVSRYIQNGLLTPNHTADLTHVAMATINEMDMLVSWNMRHIVKHRTRTLVNAVNQIHGYRTIDICTPEEVVDYGIS